MPEKTLLGGHTEVLYVDTVLAPVSSPHPFEKSLNELTPTPLRALRVVAVSLWPNMTMFS